MTFATKARLVAEPLAARVVGCQVLQRDRHTEPLSSAKPAAQRATLRGEAVTGAPSAGRELAAVVDEGPGAGPPRVRERPVELQVGLGAADDQIVGRVQNQPQAAQCEALGERAGVRLHQRWIGEQLTGRHPYLDVSEAGRLVGLQPRRRRPPAGGLVDPEGERAARDRTVAAVRAEP